MSNIHLIRPIHYDVFRNVASQPYYYGNPYTKLQVSPSITMTNGYMFNVHWAADIGVGFEIFDQNLVPVFADVRYTLWDNKMSPYFVFKTGYAFANAKKKHYDHLYLNYEPYYAYNAYFRNHGGYMLHPEMGVKIPLSENADLLFTLAYRYQKMKSEIWQNNGVSYLDEWEHKGTLHRLLFGIAIMFR